MKMTDAEGIAEFFNSFTVFSPDHPHQITLDVTDISAPEAAASIVATVEELEQLAL